MLDVNLKMVRFQGYRKGDQTTTQVLFRYMWDWSGGEERFLVFRQKPRRLFWPETRIRSVAMHIAKLENPGNRSKKLTWLLAYWRQCIVHKC
jgi:hypothetical protein